MRTVSVCGPAAKLIPELIDAYNGEPTAPKAITVGDIVFFFGEPTPQLVKHEAKHILQAKDMQPAWLRWWPWAQQRAGWIKFWWAYGKEHEKNGYWNNRFEVEARQYSGEE